MTTQRVAIILQGGGKISGILALPRRPGYETGIILAHGAGNDMEHPLIVFLADSLAREGFPTLRFNFPYREEGRNRPDGPEILREAWDGAYRFLSSHPWRPARIVAAGKSLGGRIASHMVAEDRLSVDGLVFLGYPLHAPGKRESPRDGHLYGIAAPMLFFAGTRDSLCDLEVLRSVLMKLKAPWELEVIEGGDHSFNVPKALLASPEDIRLRILQRVLGWLKAGTLDSAG